jgi:hypothetical protein
LIHRPWRVRYGPEWRASFDAADPGDGYFEQDVARAEETLRTSPWGSWAYPFLTPRDDLWILEIDDYKAGYCVIVMYAVDKEATAVELKWVELGDLDA